MVELPAPPLAARDGQNSKQEKLIIVDRHPAPKAPAKTMTNADESSEASKDGCVKNDLQSSKKILIIDDDMEIIQTVSFALQSLGYHVVVAHDGNQGIALSESESPDLIILDMMMPKRSGFMVLESLRRNHEDPVPVIMVTGNDGNRHQAYAELLGVSDYIHKPFVMDRLLKAVQKLIQ